MEDDSEKILDVTEARDSKKLIGLTCGDELVLLVPSVCCRRLAMHAINWASLGFLGTCSSCEVKIHGAMLC